MKVLIVCSGNVKDFNFEMHHAFVYEQIEEIKKEYNVLYDTFFIKGKGILGYLKNIIVLKEKIRNYEPDFIHAHFGLSGLLAVLQRNVPVIITFHGSDINIFKVKILSRIAATFSQYDIFVSDRLYEKIQGSNKHSIVPCGINLEVFYPVDMMSTRKRLNIEPDKNLILFSSSFDNPVKNSTLAFAALKLLNVPAELIELKNKNREQVNLLLNASNLLLLTSFSEGSPQVIKEAMACNCPIVATDVGDISEVVSGTEGCFITSFDPVDVAEKIEQALKFRKRTAGREKIKHFDNKIIAEKVFNIYKMVSGDPPRRSN